ncbi:MAG TPA: nuclease-related domain-containing protein [Thermomicrobiales bacterium]
MDAVLPAATNIWHEEIAMNARSTPPYIRSGKRLASRKKGADRSMPHIFAGADRQQIDPEVLEAFKTLPDDFWVFAEFTMSRNIDWFVIHPNADGTLALIVIELKRTGLPLAGDINNVWKQWTPEGWRDLVLSGPYRNYYWQAVEAANTLKEWLWNNQRRFRLRQDLLTQDAFKVWPDLLILSPQGINHQLPLQPPNNFGKFIFTLSDCLRHITTWKSRQLSLVPLVDEELLRLAEALGLERVWPLARPQDYDSLAARIQHLEERMRRLEATLDGYAHLSASPPPPGHERLIASPPAPSRYPNGIATVSGSGQTFATGVFVPNKRQASASRPLGDGGDSVSPSLELAFSWIEQYLRQHDHNQPLRLADLGNGLKNRHNFDARKHFGLSLTAVLNQLAETGRVRLSYRDRVPYVSLPHDSLPEGYDQVANETGERTSTVRPIAPEPPVHAPVESPPVRQKLGKDGMMVAVQIIAAVEDLAGGRVAQTASFLKHLRESLPLSGVPALSNGEANRLLREEFVALGYLKVVTVHDIDLTTGDLYTTDGYRLNREHPAVQIMLDMGTPSLKPEVEIRTFAVMQQEASLHP